MEAQRHRRRRCRARRRVLLVEENTEAGVRLNQPAGHWEHGESILDAVRRETLEKRLSL